MLGKLVGSREPPKTSFFFPRHGTFIYYFLKLEYWRRQWHRASLVAMVKDLPAMQETQVRTFGQEDPLKEGMATHSSVRA